MELKETLQSFSTLPLADRQVLFSQQEDALLQQMLAHIGSTDAELRDHLIYRTFIDLLSDNMLNTQQLQYLFDKATSETFLYAQIGEINTDSVFTRSFSALLVAGILAKDAELLALEDNSLQAFFQNIGRYLLWEMDTRGYVDGKGWAHSIAHGADLVTVAIKHPKFDIQHTPSILHALKSTTWKDMVYTNDEEERLTNIIEALIDRGYSEEALIEWVEQVFAKFEFQLLTQGYNNSFFYGRTCTLNVMKTLYFALKMNNQAPELQNMIYAQVAKWLKLGN